MPNFASFTTDGSQASVHYSNEDAAQADCSARNDRATSMGIPTRYVVGSENVKGSGKPRENFAGLPEPQEWWGE